MTDDGLKLAALDADDLAIVSAHLQDAVLKRGEMRFSPSVRRFALSCNRFDWLHAAGRDGGGIAGRLGERLRGRLGGRLGGLGGRAGAVIGKGTAYRRRKASLVIDHVARAAHSGFADADPASVLNLLSIGFAGADDGEDPSGAILLHFAGGGCVRLEVDCVEARLKDEGPVWSIHARPRHRTPDLGDGG